MKGQTFGRFRVTDKLGEGGMGAVYLAEHELIGKRVAVKVLLPRFVSSEDVLRRFFNEAVAAASIAHPGIVEIFDYGVGEAGEAFIVMEALEGEPLSARIRRGPMAAADAVRLIRQAAGALGAAHGSGIVHRDLKPDNLFVVADPEVAGGERVKLLDFGIARLTGAGGVKTQTGAIFGTPSYMAPEQCAGTRSVDARADLYALGVILYEMLTGAPPFRAPGLGGLFAQHLLEPPVPLSSHIPHIPPAIDALVLALLAKDPSHRPATARVLVDQLAALEASGALTTTAPLASSPDFAATQLPVRTTLGAAAAQSIPAAFHNQRPRRWLGALGVCVVTVAVVAGMLVGSERVSVAPSAEVELQPIAAARGAPVDLDAAHARLDTDRPRPTHSLPKEAELRAAREPVARAEPEPKPTPATKPVARAKREPAPTPVPSAKTESADGDLAAARAAMAAGRPRRAIEHARKAARGAQRQRALVIMVRAYCQLHNGHAARAIYPDLSPSSQATVRSRCKRSGVELGAN